MPRRFLLCCSIVILSGMPGSLKAEDKPAPSKTAVSFSSQILPLLQAKCLGCHQPAKSQGGYVMTDFKRLLAGGDSEKQAVVPGQPEESELVAQIRSTAGAKPLMPKNAPPLHDQEVELISQWIRQGAKDDRTQSKATKYDADHPPSYTQLPTITSIDFSPDGKLLASSGHHEVFLTSPATGKLESRLVGLSERIQSIRFSPDGKKLAVAGGSPGRFGELQIWDPKKARLLSSIIVGHDTIYGASWSADGKLIAVGCSDNTVRAFDATSGQQVLQQGAHNDWVLGTTFTKDNAHLISVSRDMTAKLTEVASQRFVDNVTSITPGVLKGGIQTIVRHPVNDEILVGGADGEPKVYRVFRTTARKIGDDANLIKQLPAMAGRIFDVAINMTGTHVAAVSSLDNSGQLLLSPYPSEVSKTVLERIKSIESKEVFLRSPEEKEELAKLRKANPALDKPISINVPGTSLYAVALSPDSEIVAAGGTDGRVYLFDTKSGKMKLKYDPVPLNQSVSQSQTDKTSVDFIRDVNPILSRLGCNQGTCHGAQAGKNGFKLSLRGYDAIFDIRALTDDLAGRRVNTASPDESLMLLKATNAVPHVGGQVLTKNDPYYQILKNWIGNGAKLNLKSARVTSITLNPLNPVIASPKESMQFRVMASYSDGTTRDVTNEAFVESGNADVATAAARGGKLTANRRGEAPVLARYEGAYAATLLTVMGDRTGFTWKEFPTYNTIDTLTSAKWKRLKIQPSALASDLEFLRRVYLDLTGLPPTLDDIRGFIADERDSRIKRDALIDRLIGSKQYVEYWTNKWADLLQVNRKFLGVEGAVEFRKWIRNEVEKNTPYDQFVFKILTASGSNRTNPPAAYYKILRDPAATMENTTHLFLGVRFNCNKCHDHPFEKWTQDQYYEMAAYFARFGLKPDPESKDRKIGGTAVEGAKPLFEIVFEKPDGDMVHDRTGQVTDPKFPYGSSKSSEASRRDQLAQWLTSEDNQYFARSYVNRIWGYLFGVGIIEPIDDIRAGNPPTNPELLDYLTKEFLNSDFNVRHIHALICKSRTYQLSIETNHWNEDDKTNFSHAVARRLPAEVLYDTVHRTVGAVSKIPGVPTGTRAAELPDSGVDLPTRFLGEFGRPVRESACECERTSGLQLGPVMALVNGQTIADAINDPANELATLAKTEMSDDKLINTLFLRILNRPATRQEIEQCLPFLKAAADDHQKLQALVAAREKEVAPIQAAREQERLANLKQAEHDRVLLEKALIPVLLQAEKDRLARIASADAKLQQYENKLPQKVEEFVKSHTSAIDWQTIAPKSLKAVNGAKLEVLPDGSIRASGKNGKGAYVLNFETSLTDITGIRLEVIADEQLPGQGPGRAPNGNFVLNQFTVTANAKGNPKEKVAVSFKTASTNFAQEGFDIKGTIDGTPNSNKGWAVVPHTGLTHWAVFETKTPFGFKKGTLFSINLMQNFGQEDHSIGRLRISVTRAKPPLPLGLAEEYQSALKKSPSTRELLKNKAIANYVKAMDPEFQRLKRAFTESRNPVPPDAKLTALQATIAKLKQPIPEDAILAGLKRDLEFSATQAANARLTGVQDIAWALINSPAFLFNR